MLANLFARRDSLKRMEEKRVAMLQKNCVPESVAPLFQHPVPQSDCLMSNLQIVALDFETTGLDPDVDSILSAGMVEMYKQRVRLLESEHFYFSPRHEVNAKTAVVNHICPEMLQQGVSLKEGMRRVIDVIAGKVVLSHASCIEQQFIRAALGLKPNSFLPIVWLDTLMLEKSLTRNWRGGRKDYRLCTIRKEKGLPAYLAHNSLADSIATAELCLVLMREICAPEKPTLGPLFQRSANG